MILDNLKIGKRLRIIDHKLRGWSWENKSTREFVTCQRASNVGVRIYTKLSSIL